MKLSKNMQVLWENGFPLKKKKNYYFCKNDYDDRSIVVKKKEKSISKMSRKDRLNLYGKAEFDLDHRRIFES